MSKKFFSYFVPFYVLAGLLVAGVFAALGSEASAHTALIVTLAGGALPQLVRMILNIVRGRFGVDIIAFAAIFTAFFAGEYLAGSVITLMLSSGEALEVYALRRARRELSALISKAPSVAHVRQKEGIFDVPADQVEIGQLVVVKPGEAVPVDGLVVSGKSQVDESALTGESLPAEKGLGSQVSSGSVNQESVLEIRALRRAAESKYEQIIRLVKNAEESRATVVRLADRYSLWFTALTFLAAAAAWLFFRDLGRLLSVLVVATPCPLILATPIAIISGISRSASRGIVVKSGGALEKLAEIKAFIFDKTGTLTLGNPEVVMISPVGISREEFLKIAASLDQLSAHILARSLLAYSRKDKSLTLDYPENFRELFGDGVKGDLAGETYYFGKLSFLKSNGARISKEAEAEHARLQQTGRIAVYLARGRELLGHAVFADTVRAETRDLFRDIFRQGVEKIVMLTGDRKDVAETIAKKLGLVDVHAECLPEQKVAEVKDHRRQFGAVAMVGDGINDAPALATADVGIAIGAHGSTASADTSDIVITVDNLQRVGEALRIAKKVLRVAKQGIFFGMGASVILMVFAAFGYIPPVYGALIQELLDVIVIVNALRVNVGKV